MKQIFGILFIVLFSLTACENNDSEFIPEELIGNWEHKEYSNMIITYKKVKNLPDDNYGIKFLDNKDLVERKNVGWCGTPPITYGDFEGNWELIDSVLDINVAYWGGKADYTWKILHLNGEELKIEIISQEFN